MTLLGLRDYFARRHESKMKGPLSDEERAAIEKMRAELPRKEVKPAWWYFLHPRDGAKLGVSGLIILPFAIIFLPMVVILFVLPSPNRK